METTAPRPLILCPLAFEAGRLRRALPSCADRIVTCGPGGAAVERALASNPSPIVILAGLAGGLDDEHPAGSAHVITEVHDGHGRVLRPTLRLDGPPCRITSRPDIVRGDERRALAARTGAHLVDLESETFAAFATAHDLPWAIVRGVSDDLRDELPRWAARLTNENGRVLIGRCLTTILTRPARLATLARLRRDSIRALDGVAALIDAWSRRDDADPATPTA